MANDNEGSAESKGTSTLRRVGLGFALALAVFAVVFWGPRWTVAFVVAGWSILATLEFLQLLRRAEVRLNDWLLGVLSFTITAAAFLGWLPGFLVAPIAVVFLAAVATRDLKPRTPVYGTFVLIYTAFLPAHLVMLRNLVEVHALSPWLVFFPLAVTWTNDTAGFLFGRLLGRTRLAPSASPNKTVEGYAAGLIFSAILSAFYLSRLEPFAGHPVWWLAGIGVGLGTLAQAGDLFESIFKRAVGIKDTSTALAEHGGFLDRVDSLIFTIPAFFYLVILLLR